ncbi:MAG: hypothetical protein KEFWMYNX_000390 [Candidatus Fervidibacter sp.]|jgi:hypothetical protein
MKVLGKSAVRQVGRCPCGLTATEQLLRWCERHSRSETVTFQNTDRSVSHCPNSGRFNGKPSRWHEGNPSLWVVANPCDAEPMKVWSLITLPIEPNVCRPENRSCPCRQIQVEGIIQADTPRIRPLNKFRPISRRLKNEAVSLCESEKKTHRPLSLRQCQPFRGDKSPQSVGDFQVPMKRQKDTEVARYIVTTEFPCPAHQSRVFIGLLHPQKADRCVSDEPVLHSSSLQPLRAFRCWISTSSKLPFALLIILTTLRHSLSSALSSSRCISLHFLRVFSGSSQPMTGISFPSTTIVPTIFGLLLRFRFSAIYRRLLLSSQFCRQSRKSMDEIRYGGER